MQIDSASRQRFVESPPDQQVCLATIYGWIGKTSYGVKFLDDDPTARFQGVDHSSQRHFAVWKMNQYQSGMREIELSVR